MNRLFIIGIGRSGSTLLSKTLGSHPDCLDNPEIPLFSFFYKVLRNNRFNSERNHLVVRFINAMKRRHPGHPWQIQPEEIAQIPRELDYFSYMNQLSTLFTSDDTSEKNAQGPKWIIDKNPVNTLHAHHFLKEYPQTKAIFLVRDPRANVASRIQSVNSVHGRNNHWILNAIRWKRYNRRFHHLMRNYSSQIYLLRYEQFVTHPQQTIDELCAFLGLSPMKIDEVATLNSNGYNKANARLNKKYVDLNQPISPRAVEQWREVLDLRQQETIEFICRNEMHKFGYECETNATAYIPLTLQIIAFWYDLKEKLLFHLPLSLKLKRLE